MRPRSASITTLALLASLAASCGLGDAFAPGGAGDVEFVWQGPPDLTINIAVPLNVQVLVDGSPLANPNLVVTFPDPTRIDYASTTDSIVGLRNGQGQVAVRLVSSLATTPVDTVFSFLVHP